MTDANRPDTRTLEQILQQRWRTLAALYPQASEEARYWSIVQQVQAAYRALREVGSYAGGRN